MTRIFLSVRSRMENEGGISFTEFSYQLLQAYDFWHLYNYFDCRVQLGGSDQWGNITTGIDLIHKKRIFNITGINRSETTNNTDHKKEEDAFGITTPLLLTSSGEKFGKSAGNAVWLDDKMTSAYEFYQESPEKYYAQEKLASEMTEMVHGLAGLQRARVATDIIFGIPIRNMRSRDVTEAFSNDPQHLISLNRKEILDCTIDRVAVVAGACKSRSEANKLIKSGGLYLNNERIGDPQYKLVEEDLLEGMLFVFRTGKSNYRLVKIID
ncbi:6630_t:CDS:2 [Acaulospora colombiana]|uniref:6630_t:CDS:1 n=1 Tax=Acaulospora colombiana TaxID=27376 RepID=A0ACA9LZZ3_9GLOM|nr:6630_t:CDS:2 [Acaulospora colombiana]